ncbi:MAG: hypothetical protein AAFZ15_09495 [Bacteroidota bacterium]
MKNNSYFKQAGFVLLLLFTFCCRSIAQDCEYNVSNFYVMNLDETTNTYTYIFQGNGLLEEPFLTYYFSWRATRFRPKGSNEPWQIAYSSNCNEAPCKDYFFEAGPLEPCTEYGFQIACGLCVLDFAHLLEFT